MLSLLHRGSGEPRGPRSALRTCGAVLLAAGLLLLLAAPGSAQSDTPIVDVLQIEGALDAPMASYVDDAVADAAAEDVEVVVLQLSSTGALGVELDRLVAPLIDSGVPVVVWAGPPGARVTGAGAVLAQAGHLLGQAPGTVLGAAAPADLAAGDADPADRRALSERLGELARVRGRSVPAAQAMAQGRAYAALVNGRPLSPEIDLPQGVDAGDVIGLDGQVLVEQDVIDLSAAGLDDVLRELDGRTVTLAGGQERTLDVDPVTALVRFRNPGLLARMLHTVVSPTLAYLLLIAGALAILFELFQPGFGVAGFSGLALAALAMYGVSVLPARWWALGLVVIGLLLLAADLSVAGLGLLTVGGAVALGVGSWFLFAAPLMVPAWIVGATVAFNVLFFVIIMTVVLRAQGVAAVSGAQRVIGKAGVVRSMLNPEGHVYVEGGLWRARAPEGAGRVKTGTPVRIVGLNDGSTLEVEILDETVTERV
ncbi:MAG: NfeD family protein [Egibacteraceae bacterium]